jgi:hypothetical protein
MDGMVCRMWFPLLTLRCWGFDIRVPFLSVDVMQISDVIDERQ